jgi:hypothetical protein
MGKLIHQSSTKLPVTSIRKAAKKCSCDLKLLHPLVEEGFQQKHNLFYQTVMGEKFYTFF